MISDDFFDLFNNDWYFDYSFNNLLDISVDVDQLRDDSFDLDNLWNFNYDLSCSFDFMNLWYGDGPLYDFLDDLLGCYDLLDD